MLPHFGYHIMVIAVQALTSADWSAAAGLVTLGGVAACAVVLVPAAVLVLQPVLPLEPTDCTY